MPSNDPVMRSRRTNAKLVGACAMFPDGGSSTGYAIVSTDGARLLGFADVSRTWKALPAGTSVMEFGDDLFVVFPEYPEALELAMRPDAQRKGFRHVESLLDCPPYFLVFQDH